MSMRSLFTSPIIIKYVLGFSFCRFVIEDLRVLSAIETFDVGRMYTFMRVIFDVSLGRKRGRDLTAISSMSGVDIVQHILGLEIDQFFAM